MSEELIEELARLDRDTRAPREWDDVLEGRRSASEVARERREQGDDPEDVEALAQASAPLGASERAAWVRRLRAGMREADDADDDAEHEAAAEGEASARSDARAEPERAEDESSAEREAQTPVAQTSAAVVDLSAERSRRRPWVVGLTVVVAAAAVLVLWTRPGPSPDGGPGVGARLPSFELVVRNETVHEMRGDEADEPEGPARYRPDTKLRWMIRPSEAATTPVELALLVEGDRGALCMRRPTVSRASNDGIFEVRGTAGTQLDLSPGRWRLHGVVAPKGTLESAAFAERCAKEDALPCPCPPGTLNAGPGVPMAEVRTAVDGEGWGLTEPYEIVIEDA